MDPNRFAEPDEREATTRAIRIAVETRQQRIADARKKLEVLAADAARTHAYAGANPLRPEAHTEFLVAAAAERGARHLLEALVDGSDVRRLQGLLHPIRKLPPEILSNIFLKTIQEYLPMYGWESVRRPCYIVGVCRRWRAVALETPQLWRHIRGTYDLEPDSRYLAAMMEVWMERALDWNMVIDLSLNILRGAAFPGTQRPPVLVPIQKALSRGAVTSLRLFTPYMSSIVRDLFPAGASYSALQSLELTGSQEQQDLVDRLTQIAPNLRSIALTVVHFNSPVRPHPNVRSVRVVSTGWIQGSTTPKDEALAHLLAAFPGLTSLTLDLCFMEGEVCGSALLRHDTLRSLHIYEPEGFTRDPPLAMAYSFPQLRYATFELQTREDEAEEVHLGGPMQLLIHGLSTLHSLEFDVEIAMAKLLPALRNMSFLESLVCDRGHPDEGFCAALAFPTYTGWLCPRLRLVTLQMELAELQECTDAISARNDAQTAGATIARVERLTGPRKALSEVRSAKWPSCGPKFCRLRVGPSGSGLAKCSLLWAQRLGHREIPVQR